MSDMMSEGSVGVLEILKEAGVGTSPVNRQLYQNREDAQAAFEDLKDLVGIGAGVQPPNLVIDQEKSQHKIVMVLKLQGMTNREIARKMNFSETWVSQIVRQPWFQAQLMTSIEELKGEVLDNILAIEAKASVLTLVDMRDNAKSEAVRVTSAVQLLDRYMGKPIQRTESQVDISHRTVEAADIKKELEQVEEQLAQLKGTRVEKSN